MHTLKRIAASSLAAACTIAMSPAALGATEPGTIVVDDDRLQCPDADFDSISEAVDSASAGDTVQVCPGVYTEFVQVDRPLTLVGTPGAVEALDCFDPTQSAAGDLDPATYAVLTRPPDIEGDLLTVASAGVRVTGMVLEGALTPNPVNSIYDAAIHLLYGTAGARLDRNLVRHNSLGIDLGSAGAATTRVDHNCLRENRFGMAAQRQDFVAGVVENNHSFRHEMIGYEVGDNFGSRQSVYAHNVSRQDGISFFVRNSWNVSIADNDLEPAGTGVALRSGNTNVRVTSNRIVGGTNVGVAFAPAAGSTSQKVLVAGNDISGFGRTPASGFGISIGSNAAGQPSVDGVKVMDNVLSHNGFGISVQLNNLGVRVHGNTSSDNSQFGIRAVLQVGTASSASSKDNVMLGNGSPDLPTTADASDNNRSANTWADNVCERDIPNGTICGV